MTHVKGEGGGGGAGGSGKSWREHGKSKVTPPPALCPERSIIHNNAMWGGPRSYFVANFKHSTSQDHVVLSYVSLANSDRTISIFNKAM